MAEPKALSFGSAPSPAPAPKPAPGGPKPLAFPPSAPPPATPAPKPVFFDNGGQWVDGRLVVKTAPDLAPAPQAARPLSFDNVVVPAHARPAPPPPVPSSVQARPSNIHEHALRQFKQASPELFAQEELSVTRQIQQLIPLKLEVVLDWGAKTLRRMADDANEANMLMQTISLANASGTMKGVMDAISGAKPAGLLNRLMAKAVDPASFEPKLLALQPQFAPWIKQCEERIASAEKQARAVAIKGATIAAVADSIDVISDNDIDRAVNARRMVLTQGAQQAELNVQQLKQTRQLLIDQRLQVDQILNNTLPAIKASRAVRR